MVKALKKYWFQITLLVLIALPIVLLCFFDYFNIEGYNYRFNPSTNGFEDWDNKYFSQNFSFDVTWKGRMFYLFFAWFLVIESAFGWQEINDKKPKNRYLLLASLVCAAIPTFYVLATNFFGLDFTILQTGLDLKIPSVYSDNSPSDFLHLYWPLSVEYMVFFIFFMTSIMLAYKPKGLKIFAISFSLLGGIAVAYMLDTIFPFGVLRPLQEIALPTTATTAALFDILGYKVMLNYPVYTGGSALPGLVVNNGVSTASVSVSWACAGIYSLLLYVLIMLVFFKRTNITSFRKLLYFIIGLFGTFISSVLRIFSIVMIYLYYGKDAGITFHNTYGELFGFIWIFAFILLIVCIERFMLVERTREAFRKTGYYLRFSKK